LHQVQEYCKTDAGSPCPIHYVPEQLGFCMDGNANPCGEFTKYCICLSKVRELAAKLTCADFTTWCPLPAQHYQVYEPKADVLVVYFSITDPA